MADQIKKPYASLFVDSMEDALLGAAPSKKRAIERAWRQITTCRTPIPPPPKTTTNKQFIFDK